MNENSEVVVIGDIFADMISRVISYPSNGEGTYGTPLERNGGGTGGNVAAGLGTLKVPTTMICRLGNDETGRFLKEDLAKYGVDTGGIVLDYDTPTGTVVITVDPQGERTIFVFALNSAYGKLNISDVDIIEKIQPKAIFLTGVLLGLEIAENTIFEVANKWKGRARLYFDPNLRHPTNAVPSSIRDSMQRMSKLCDVVLTGKSEMGALGLYPQEEQVFIVKCGKEGSYSLDGNGQTVYTVPPTSHIAIDATGAGDTFAAAYISAELKGYGVKESMEFATIVAGISVTRNGARSMPGIDEIKQFYQNKQLKGELLL
ncbi:carbohydrate kinase family protein [Bacillus sp. S3]|uniref:carbohydrate kinase family protein n=1 Tax=Bacillus sp. S3 TaxID=486398 RepID=UPI00118A593A|nr:carbohydrate kinase family protein [Bacillus sp. S3]QCJ44722.1 carbohydrate kinase family protein [Bacillus sp. S3]